MNAIARGKADLERALADVKLVRGELQVYLV